MSLHWNGLKIGLLWASRSSDISAIAKIAYMARYNGFKVNYKQ